MSPSIETSIIVYKEIESKSWDMEADCRPGSIISSLQADYTSLDDGAYTFVTSYPRRSTITIERFNELTENLINFLQGATNERIRQEIQFNFGNEGPTFRAWSSERLFSEVCPTLLIPEDDAIRVFLIPRRFVGGEGRPSPSKKPKLDGPAEADNIGGLQESNSADSLVTDDSEKEDLKAKSRTLHGLIAQVVHSDLCDPSITTQVPYPSLEPAFLSESPLVPGEYPTLELRGRSVLEGLLKKVETSSKLVLQGSFGSGAEYLATAAAITLLSQGRPVVFLRGTPRFRVRTHVNAFLLALSASDAADEDHCSQNEKIRAKLYSLLNKRQNLHAIRALMDWMTRKTDRRMIFVYVDFHSLSDEDRDIVKEMTLSHTIISTGNPNHPSIHKQPGADYFTVPSGLEPAEIDGWKDLIVKQAKAELLTLNKKNVEYIFSMTGAVPRLIDGVIQNVRESKQKAFSEELVTGTVHILNELLDTIGPTPSLDIQQPIIQSLMSHAPSPPHLCLARLSPDRRHVLLDIDRWVCPSLMHYRAFEILVIRIESAHLKLDLENWLQLTREMIRKKNQVMVRFAVKGAALAIIKTSGLSLTLKKASLRLPMGLKTISFSKGGIPPISHDCFLVPVEYNYPNIDAAAVTYNQTKKKVVIVLFQISIIKKKTGTKFFEEDWKAWKRQVDVPPRWSLEWHFVWEIQLVEKRAVTINRGSRYAPRYCEWVTRLMPEVLDVLNGF